MSALKLKHASGNGAIINAPAANPSADITLKVPSTTGSAGQVLKIASANHSSTNAELEWAAASGGLFSSYAVIVDQKSQNTEAGTFTQDAWQTRDLNTESFDPDGIVSISSNKFTLAAGSYLIVWSAPCYKVDKNQTRLYDVTNSSAGAGFKGSVEHAGTTTAIQVRSTGAMRVSPSGSNEYRIEHKCAATRSTNGFGFAANLAAEIFTIVEIYKEA